ncbi:MAG: WD40 repeat domain-containing serine/threonine-protein kinase [Pseudomonadota bacterium]|nr:WD40 repeat domain-containing serine/threonine-protein kinase [Pseudomonadota bacterium]
MGDSRAAEPTVQPQSGQPITAGRGMPEERLGAPDPAPRYEVGGLLGRGGMGEVHVARDPRLGRDVALKTSRPENPDGARRLAREASLTARLEHPNIVPVYAAGRDPSGAPYYTMRVLSGRTLASAIAEAGSLSARLQLVRNVLGAAEAIAYAHGRGVLHRDLKPANIMVGMFGESLVTDWGLACTFDKQDEERGGGTPGFASPEQQSGAHLDGRADVYGLGATLFTILTGTAPPLPAPPLRAVLPEAPPELAAIVDRALQADPARRYPGARALADDLLAWFEGRRVAAHVYTPRDLALRLWASWRVPIVVGVVGAVALATAVGVGWFNTSQERVRAQHSEGVALAAKAAEEEALASALLAQALSAAREERAMDAEVLAANALVRRELPEARGVLAQFGGRPRMSLLRRSALPACEYRDLSPDGSLLLCADSTGARLYRAHDDGVVASAPGSYFGVNFAGENGQMVLIGSSHELYAWAPPEAPRRIDLIAPDAKFGPTSVPGTISLVSHSTSGWMDTRAGTSFRWRACVGAADQGTAIAADGSVFTTCEDRRVVHGLPGEPGRLFVTLAERDAATMVATGSAGEVLVSTVRGSVLVFDAEGHEIERFVGGGETPHALAIRPDRIAVSFDDGTVMVWERGSRILLASFRVDFAHLVWVDAIGSVLRIVGPVMEDRAVSLIRYPHRIATGSGVSGLALSPDIQRVAVGLGDGRVREFALADGAPQGSWSWSRNVAKDVAYDPTGTLLATAISTDLPQRILTRPGGLERLLGVPEKGLRRVVWLRNGWLLACSYLPEVWGWKEGIERPIKLADVQLREFERDPSGAGAAGLDLQGGVWRVDDAEPPRIRRVFEVPDAGAVAAMGDATIVLTNSEMIQFDGAGTETWRAHLGVPSQDLALSPDHTLVAVALIDGDVTIWKVGAQAPLARLVGHTSRVGELAFSTDGRWLVTGGWDDTIRLWSMTSLQEPAAAVKARLEGEWGTGLAEALGDR